MTYRLLRRRPVCSPAKDHVVPLLPLCSPIDLTSREDVSILPPLPTKTIKNTLNFSTMRPHCDTPTKAKVRGAYGFLQIKGLPSDPREMFDTFEVNYRAEYRMLEPEASSRQSAHQGLIKTRGRKNKMTAEQVREADHVLQDDLDLKATDLIS